MDLLMSLANSNSAIGRIAATVPTYFLRQHADLSG
jgi:hypothetical protein